MGRLDGGQAVAIASGMAASAAVPGLMAPGRTLVLSEDCPQSVTGLAAVAAGKGQLNLERLATEDTEGWIRASRTVGMLWLESPSNPLLKVADLKAILAAPTGRDTLRVVDHTLATALNVRPLMLGADVAVQSATKFVGGHSDLLTGVVATRSSSLLAALKEARMLAGATPGALETFLALRGVRTLHLRLERAQDNARTLAARLAGDGRVRRVHYPGLASHPSHSHAVAQMAGPGAVLAFETHGTADDADATCRRLKLIRHATSLGGVESTLERRAAIPGQEHLPPTLLRLSVGIEHVEDLWHDLNQALGS